MTTHSQPSEVPLVWTFGDHLRKIRRALGLTQAELAAVLDATPQAVGAWELDTNVPRNLVEQARKLEKAYGVNPAWTLGLVNEGTVTAPSGPDGGNGGLTSETRRTGVWSSSALTLVAA